MANENGGCFIPQNTNYAPSGNWTFTGTVTDTGTTLASPTITDPTITGTTTIGAGATITSPVLVTPTLGVALATSINGNVLTTGSSTYTGTAAQTYTFPTTSATIARTDAANTFTGVQTMTSAALTTPVLTGSVTGTYTLAGTPTLTAPTINGAINTDFKVLAGNATYTSTVTPATLTGFSWTVVAGTYVFDMNLPATLTTVGGLTINFLLTTAVLTSIQYQSYASTAADNSTAVSTQGTTTTSGTKVFDSKTAAYTLVRVTGSMVVGTGGTFAWQGTQNTSAGGGDVSVVLLGSFARLTRVA